MNLKEIFKTNKNKVEIKVTPNANSDKIVISEDENYQDEENAKNNSTIISDITSTALELFAKTNNYFENTKI